MFLQSDTAIFDVCGQTCFDISLQYLKRQMNDEVHFLHAGKHENLQQIDTMILMEMVKHFLVKHFQSSKNSMFPISVQYLKKED